MTTAVSGWVILEGDYNYCLYNDELYFLKKDILISSKKKKYRYILIKDHFCNILKNKGNVFVRGTLTNASLDRLGADDFNFTLPVINNFGKRLLFPLESQQFNWKKHLFPKLPTIVFPERPVVTPENFAYIIKSLENIALLRPNYNPATQNEVLVLFHALSQSKLRHKVSDWRNEIIQKIKDLLARIHTDDIILGKVSAGFQVPSLRLKWCITHLSSSIADTTDDFKEVLNLDLSGLTDIRSVQFTDTSRHRPFVPDDFKLFYDATAVPEDQAVDPPVIRLERRVRLSLSNPYSTRAIYKGGGKFYSYSLNDPDLYPQKILIRNTNPLVFKTDKRNDFYRNKQAKRNLFGEEFRSVYLYYCDNFDFILKWNSNLVRLRPDSSDSKTSFTSFSSLVLKQEYTPITMNVYRWWDLGGVLDFILYRNYPDGYSYWDVYPKNKESIPFGWLVGQFSRFIQDNYLAFDPVCPFLVRSKFSSLKRIKGLKPVVQQLIQNVDFFEQQATSPTYDPTKVFTLDWFNYYPRRFIEDTKELDFQIGEKLLFFTWGPLAYTYFQPCSKEQDYGIYWYDQLLPNTVSKNIDSSWNTYFYPYDLWNFNVPNDYGRQWMKKAYDDFKPYPNSSNNKPFLANNVDRYRKKFLQHAYKNTQAFFLTETETAVSANKGDYFWTDLDYYFVDDTADSEFKKSPNTFAQFNQQKKVILQNNDIVICNDIAKGKLFVGRLTITPLTVTLPDGQFYASDPSYDESSQNKIHYNAFRISNASASGTTFSDFNTLIEDLKDNAHLYYEDWFNFSFEQVKGKAFLFRLVGTNFWAYLDAEGKISLIFDDAKDIAISGTQVYSIDVDIASQKLLPLQIVNQRATLSFYGMKFDLPVKVFENKATVNILMDSAKFDLTHRDSSVVNSMRVEIRHSLGTSYFRVDVPNKLTRSTIGKLDPFQVEALESSIRRSYEDYKLQKQAQDLEFQAIDNQFDDQRWSIAQGRRENLVNSILSGIGQVTSFASGLAATGIGQTVLGNAISFGYNALDSTPPTLPNPDRPRTLSPFDFTSSRFLLQPKVNYLANWKMNQLYPRLLNPDYKPLPYDSLWRHGRDALFNVGDFRVRGVPSGRSLLASSLGQATSQIGGTVASYFFNSEKFDRQEEQLARDIKLSTQEKLLQSYQLDLSFNRLRAGTVLQLRKMFSFQNFSSISDRERNQVLDKQEDIPVDEIYLELWIPSVEQLPYLSNYHEKFGIDCRIPNQSLYIRDNMSIGLFRFEDPEIVNLNDFIDLELMKAKFADGVHIVTWEESEVFPDLIPVDPRVLKLQNQLAKLQQQGGVLQKFIEQEKQRVEYLTGQVQEISRIKVGLEHDLEDEKNQVKALIRTVQIRDDTIREQKSLVKASQDEVIRLNTEVSNQGQRYHNLSESYRAKETEAAEQTKLAKLYLGQKNDLTKKNKEHLEQISRLQEANSAKEQQITTLTKKTEDLQEQFIEKSKDIDSCNVEKNKLAAEKLAVELKVSILELEKIQLQGKIDEFKDENIELHKKILSLEQAPKTTASLIDTHKNVDYLITTDSNDKVIVARWNKDKNIWQEDSNLVVKRNTQKRILRLAGKTETYGLEQYPIWNYFKNNWGHEFNETVNKYSKLQEYLDGSSANTDVEKARNADAWLGRGSVELDRNIPYLTKDGNLAKDYWYHPENGWFDHQVEGSQEVKSIEKYEELNKNIVGELQSTIKGLREIAKFREGNEASPWAPLGLSKILYSIYYTGKAEYAYFCRAEDFAFPTQQVWLYKWDLNACCLLSNWNDASKYKVRKMSTYYSNYFFSWKFDRDSFNTKGIENSWNSGWGEWVRNKGLTEVVDTGSNKGPTYCVYVGLFKIIQIEESLWTVLPRINMVSEITNDNYKTVYLHTSVWWDPDNFTFKKEEVVGQKKISLYTEYLDFLGLKWDESKKKAVPKSSD